MKLLISAISPPECLFMELMALGLTLIVCSTLTPNLSIMLRVMSM